jgi:hypothetical protein
MNFNLDNLSEIIDEVLTEFCVTYPIPNFDNKEQLEHLRSVLEQFGAEAFTDIELMEAISLAPKKFSLEAAPKHMGAVSKTKMNKNSAADQAHKLHLIGKGGISYGPEGNDLITHINKDGKLIKLPQPRHRGKDGKTKVAPTPNAVTKTQPKAVTKTQPKATPVTKSQTTATTNNKLQDDDAFFPKNKVSQLVEKGSAEIDNIKGLTAKDKVLAKLAFTRAMRGEDLSKDEKAIATDIFTIPTTEEAKIYFASEKGNFNSKSRTQVKIGVIGDEQREELYKFAENNDIFDKGKAVGRKTMVASKLTDKRYNAEAKPIKEGGKITGVQIGKTILKKVNIPKIQDLAKELKTKGIPDADREAQLVISALKRNNGMVDFIAAQGKIESIDFGGDTSTPEGRTTVITNMQKMMYTRLNSLLTKYNSGGPATPEQKKVMDILKTIKAPNEKDPKAVQNYINQIDKLGATMVDTPDFRAGVPDMQEIFDFMTKLGQGYAGFMPAASNWKVTDIVTYKSTPSFLIKAGQKPSAEIVKNLQAFKSDVLIEGGLSVKFGKGGASAGMDRILMTTFKHEGPPFDTKKELIKIFETYEWAFTPGGKDKRVHSAKEINDKQKELNDVVKRAVAAGVIDKNTATEAITEGQRQAEMMIKKVIKKIPFKKYAKCFGDNPAQQKSNYESYKQQCGMWCKMGAVAEAINNADIDYQLFGNLRTKYTKKGVQHETIDGVNTVSGMGWSYDPGIAATGKECKYLALNNANSSHIEPIKK